MKSEMEFFESGDFKYSIDNANPFSKVEIEFPNKRPKCIYKFYSFSKYNVQALVNGYLYASHPFDLNDILDSSYFLYYCSKPLSIDYYQKVFHSMFDSEEELVKFYGEDCADACHTYIIKSWEMLTNLFGVISTTAQENNALMWPHYTQEQGFQLKFNVDKLEESIIENLGEDDEYLGFYPMNYTNKLKPIDLTKFRNMFIPFFYSATIKLSAWDYEDEWRFIIGKSNMGIPFSKSGFDPREDYLVDIKNRFAFYDNNLVEEIVLGRNFFNTRNFELSRNEDGSTLLKPIEDKNSHFQNYIDLLNHISTNLSEKLYCTGTKYEDENDLRLVRTKERMKIEKLDNGYFKLSRTNDFMVLK